MHTPLKPLLPTATLALALFISLDSRATTVNIDSTLYGFNSNVIAGNVGQVVSLMNFDPFGSDKVSGGTGYSRLQFTLGPGDYVWQNAAGSAGALYDIWGFSRTVLANHVLGDSNRWAWGFVAIDDSNSTVLFNSPLIQVNNSPGDLAALTRNYSGTFSLQHTTTIDFAVQDYLRSDNAGGISISIFAIPEPTSLALVSCGLLAAAVAVRRWRNTQPQPLLS